ncbi:MAG: riboflavin kinase, partial [Rickettsiales bacterium]
QCLLEVHCLDTADDMYGAKAAVEFLHFIRSEQRFEGLDALKAQIARDKEEAMMYFGKVGA